MRLFLLSFIFFSSIISIGQIEDEKEILKKLCSKEFLGRGYVANGVNLAADYIASTFKKFGAQPAGENNTYFHHFSLNVNTFPNKIEVASNKRDFKPGIHYLVKATSGSYVGDLKLKVFDPFKMIAKDKKTIKLFEKARKDPIKYEIGLVMDLTQTTNRDTLGMLNEIATELSNHCPVVLRTNEKFMWSVGRSQTIFPIIQIQDSVLGKTKKLFVDVRNKPLLDFKTKNVVAKVAGKRSDSCFVFTAHFDHLGAMGTDAYFPGANDNASGTTMILSIAKHFAENQPEFDTYFIAFSAEEAGLVGSKEFVDNPTFDIQKIKFLMNLDIMGSGDIGITAVNGTIYKEDFERLQKLNEDKKLLDVVKPRGKTQNSDHYFFQLKGIKTFFIYTMGKNKAYHDIFDKAENLDLGKFENLRTLFIDFISTYP